MIGQSNAGSDARREGAPGQTNRPRRPRWTVVSGWSVVVLLGLIVQGCPVYEDYCDSRSDCAPGFRCNIYTGDCELASYGPGPACRAPADCGPGETCGESRECRPGSCVFHGCVSGYVCSVVGGLHTCALESEAGGPTATDGGVRDASSVSDAAVPAPIDAAADSSSPSDAAADATP